MLYEVITPFGNGEDSALFQIDHADMWPVFFSLDPSEHAEWGWKATDVGRHVGEKDAVLAGAAHLHQDASCPCVV